MELSKIKKVFLIGVGGVGISALAQLFHSRGAEVLALNDEVGSATLVALQEKGIRISYDMDPASLPEADLYVYSDAWTFRGPKILEAARATGKPVLSYFEALGIVSRDFTIIAIAGTHGKTTTTAMTGETLVEAGMDPTIVVGSIVKKFKSNFRQGNGPHLVVEADEYMQHLLQLSPAISVILNIEADHLDCYKDLADIEHTFAQFVDQTSQVVICDPNDPSMKRVLEGRNIEVVDYTKYISQVPKLLVLGEHNRKDAAAALAVADYLTIPLEDAQKALAQFQGTWRRLEMKGSTSAGTVVYDDYAHHPTEAKASLSALRELYPKGEKKIIVLFQPHLYSRTKALFEEFTTAFNDADDVFFLPIYFAREAHDQTVSSELLAEAVSKHVPGARAFASFDDAKGYFENAALGAGDIFVTMGAGEAYKIGDALLK